MPACAPLSSIVRLMQISALVAFLVTTVAAQPSLEPPVELVRTLFQSEAAALAKDGFVCVQVNGVDPPPALLKTLAGGDARVVAGSACTKVMDVDKGSFHTSTHKRAYFFDVHDFVSDSESHGEIKMTIYHHGLWAIMKAYEVSKREGAWIVLRTKEHMEA